MREGNWIDGRREAAAGGDAFEPALRPGGGHEREAWPRSGPRDLERALGALRRGGAAWARLTRADRERALLERLDAWQRHAPGVDGVAERLGLAYDALDGELERALHACDRVLEGPVAGGATRASGRRASASGPVLVRVSAQELWERLAVELLHPLLGGACVVLVSDPDLPWVADETARALLEPDPEHPLAGALALLHADRPALLEAALRGGELGRAWLGGLELEPHGTPVEGAAPRNASTAVLLEEDPARRAREVLDAAFGPARALGGQRAGQVARVFCHERRLSEFTDALLEALDALPEAGRCRSFVDGLGARCARLARLGLDEGATLLRGAPEGRAGFRGAARDASLWPSVFTNVEPGMALARSAGPAPVLSLVRAGDDEVALAAARRADGA